MKRRRFENLPLLLLYACATMLLGVSAAHWITPAVLLALLLAYAMGFRLATRPTVFLTMILTLPFALWWQALDARLIVSQERYLLFIIAFYTLTMGLLHLMTVERGGKLTHPTFAAIFAVAVAGLTPRNAYYLPGIAATMALLWWWLRNAQGLQGRIRKRWQWMMPRAFVVVQIALLAFVLQKFVVERSDDLDRWMQRMVGMDLLPGSRAGFTRTAELGSMRDDLGGPGREEVMLRSFSAGPPGYLRGAAFERYDHGRWWRIEENRDLDPVARERGRNLFELADPPSNEIVATVYLLSPELDRAYFLPLGVHQLTSFADAVAWSRALTVRPSQDVSSGGYEYYSATAPLPPPDDADLHVPEALRPELERIAAELSDPEAPVATRIEQIRTAIYRDFTYHLGIDIPDGQDPLLAFLTQIKSGHCEYFAAAGALLLRSMGVHARYVTGFVCQEPGPSGRYWQARRKDAHAWVEAYLPERGWFTVEMTPPDGRPQVDATHLDKGWSDYLSAQWQRLKAFLSFGGVRGVLGALWSGIMAALLAMPIWGWIAVVATGMAWVYREPLLRLIGRRPRQAEVSAEVRALQEKLQEAERLLAAHQIYRPPGMTVRALHKQAMAADLPEATREQVLPLLEAYESQRFRRG